MRVNSFVGIPYDQMHCGGLAIHVLAHFAIELEDPGLAAIRSMTEGNGLVRFLPEDWPSVSLDELQTLDLLFICRGKTGYHVAIVGEDGWVLNTSKATGSILQPLSRVTPSVLTARRPASCCCT